MSGGMRRLLWIGVGLSLMLAGVVSRWASSAPDGLESVARGHGLQGADSPLASSPLANYEVLGNPAMSGLAGVVGVMVAGLIVWGLVKVVSPSAARSSADADESRS